MTRPRWHTHPPPHLPSHPWVAISTGVLVAAWMLLAAALTQRHRWDPDGFDE
jgi:hypothetical protein